MNSAWCEARRSVKASRLCLSWTARARRAPPRITTARLRSAPPRMAHTSTARARKEMVRNLIAARRRGRPRGGASVTRVWLAFLVEVVGGRPTFAQREPHLRAVPGLERDRLLLRLAVGEPGHRVVRPRREAPEGEPALLVGSGDVGARDHDHVRDHLRVDVAEDRD